MDVSREKLPVVVAQIRPLPHHTRLYRDSRPLPQFYLSYSPGENDVIALNRISLPFRLFYSLFYLFGEYRT